jgi:hypothetical protein
MKNESTVSKRKPGLENILQKFIVMVYDDSIEVAKHPFRRLERHAQTNKVIRLSLSAIFLKSNANDLIDLSKQGKR